jgi:hypothetical protein
MVVGGIFFGGPLGWARRGEAAFGQAGRRRFEPWGPWLGSRREETPVETDPRAEPRALQSPGWMGRLGKAAKGIASAVGRLLGAGGTDPDQRGEDVTQDFPVTREEAVHGGRRRFRLHREGDVEEILVTIPPGVRSGTRLRLRGKGAKGAHGAGDLYLRVEVP